MPHGSGPTRIQRKRTKGWRMPKGAVYVGRPSKWGNPIKVGELLTDRGVLYVVRNPWDAVELYRRLVRGDFPPSRDRTADIRRELAGRDLACWCPLDQPCHADVLLEVANS